MRQAFNRQRFGRLAGVLGLAFALIVVLGTSTASAGLIDNFDPASTAVTATQSNTAPGPVVMTGGPTGSFMRLMDVDSGSQANRIAYDRATDGGVSNTLSATYDFRINPLISNPGDGYSLVLLPTNTYGDSGGGAGFTAEEPNVAGALGIGFDLYPNLNNVSVHWDGTQKTEVAVPTGDINLDASVFHRAEVIARHVTGGSEVSVTLTPDIHGTPGTPVVVLTDYFVAGMKPYDYRAQFAARSGGAKLDVDLDNIVTGVAPVASASTDTVQDFDGGGTQYKAYRLGSGSPAELVTGALGEGDAMRLLFSENGQQNVLSFDRTATGAYGHVTASFDMKIGTGADGAGFALLNTSDYGITGTPPAVGERPSLANSFGMGFNIFPDKQIASLNWNGSEAATTDSTFDYRDSTFNTVDLDIDFVVGGAYVTASIAGNALYTDQWIAGMTPYEARLAFGGRTGGVNTTLDVDNLNVAWSNDTAVWGGTTGDNYNDNSKWVGGSGPSNVEDAIISSGQANSTSLVINAPGTLTVEDTGILNNTGSLQIGSGAGTDGTLIQTGGEVISSGDLYLANGGGSTGNYDMSDGTLTVNGTHTVVGRGGVGEFVQDGGDVNLKRLFVSEFGGSAGSSYTISDGTLTLSDRMEVGRSEAGTFTQEGGIVTVTHTDGLVVGNGSNAGVYSLEGGELYVSNLKQGTNGQFDMLGGELHADTVEFDLINTSGTLAPGTDAGTTHILGDYTQLVDGTYEIELGGSAQGTEFDWVEVDGIASLDGSLDVLFLDPFLPELGDTFEVLTATNGITDLELDINFLAPHGGAVYSIIDLAGGGQALVLTYVPEPSTWLLFVFGTACLAAMRRRRTVATQ